MSLGVVTSTVSLRADNFALVELKAVLVERDEAVRKSAAAASASRRAEREAEILELQGELAEEAE